MRSIKHMLVGGAGDDAPLHVPTPPWLEVSRSNKKNAIDRLKRTEKWSEFFSKMVAQQLPPAAVMKSGAETESGIEAGSFHGQQVSSYHAQKQESIPSSPAAAAVAATPPKSSASSQGAQGKSSTLPFGLNPLAAQVCTLPPPFPVPDDHDNARLLQLSVSSKSVSTSAAPQLAAAMPSSLPVKGSQQQQQQQQFHSSLQQPQQRPPIPPPSSQILAASAPIAPSPLPSFPSEPPVAAFQADDGGYEPDEGVVASKKNRKKSKEREAAGDAQSLSKSSESAPVGADASKPPRFRKSGSKDDPQQQQLEAAQGGGSKPPLSRTGSNVSVGSAGGDFSSVSYQATLLAFKAARCCAGGGCVSKRMLFVIRASCAGSAITTSYLRRSQRV